VVELGCRVNACDTPYVTFMSLCKRDTSRVSEACKIMFPAATVRERGFSGRVDIRGDKF
jgi:hypothetical protein